MRTSLVGKGLGDTGHRLVASRSSSTGPASSRNNRRSEAGPHVRQRSLGQVVA